jgi:glycosyltransferase involved in cell wall biosynthesis
VFAARAEAYGRIVRASHAWATNSWHEHALVDRWIAAGARGTVIPLPVHATPGPPGPSRAVAGLVPAEPVVGVFGFVYPGKGHRQVVRAVAALRRAGTMASVRVLGDAAPGHADEVEALVRTSRERGVPVEVTGRVAEDDLVRALRDVSVGVTAHRNVSASGSLNSWIAAGRRPLVRDGS